jgi:hypothetical protein
MAQVVQKEHQLPPTLTSDTELNHYTVGYWNTRAIGEPVRLMLEWMTFHRLSKGWTDVRYQVGPPPKYDKSEWYNVKEQLGMDFPNLPWLKITTSAPAPHATSATTLPLPNETPTNIVVLSQMHAIMRHLGATCNMAGHTSMQKARVDMIMEFLRDWMNAFFDVTYCNAPWLKQQEADQVHRLGLDQCVKTSPMFEVLRAEYLNVTLNTYTNRIDVLLLKCNSAGKQHNGGAAALWIAQTTEPTIADFMLFEYIDQHYIFQPTCLSVLMLAYREKCLRLPFLVRYRGGGASGGGGGGGGGSRRSSNNTSHSTHDDKEKTTTTTNSSENHEGRFQAEPLHNRYSHFHREWI